MTGHEAGGRSIEHPPRVVAGLEGGGFAIEADDGRPTVRVEPDGDGWSVTGIEGGGGWVLHRSDDRAGGFVLAGRDGADEIGRTMPLVGVEPQAGPTFLLLEDGRLFRIVRRGPRDDGFDLLGWETPGAFVRARLERNRWRLEPGPACGGLKEITATMVLFAAEILDADSELRPLRT